MPQSADDGGREHPLYRPTLTKLFIFRYVYNVRMLRSLQRNLGWALELVEGASADTAFEGGEDRRCGGRRRADAIRDGDCADRVIAPPMPRASAQDHRG